MSVQTIQSTLSRLRRELNNLERKFAQETQKETQKRKSLTQIDNSISKATSAPTKQNKKREKNRISGEIAKIEITKADLNKRISEKKGQLEKNEQNLMKEKEKERKKIEDAQKRRENEQLIHERAITQELLKQKHIMKSSREIATQDNNVKKNYDFFISHATEDKDEFVRPLAEELEKLGLKVWYDEFTLKVGDSLRRSIDNGLRSSRFGIVVFSSSFFKKKWPQYELDGLVTKEINGRQKVILPIWHKVSKNEVASYSPSLADKIALNSSTSTIQEIAKELKKVL